MKDTINGLLFLIIIVVVASAVIGGLSVFFYLNRSSSNIVTIALPNKISPTPTANPLLSPIPSLISTPPLPTTQLLSPTPTTLPQSGFVFPNSDKQLIKITQLESLTPWQLKVARNEIYARHGRAFVHKDLTCYFQKQTWYKIDSNFIDTNLTDIEKNNVQTILNYENKTSSPLLNKDSGCQQN